MLNSDSKITLLVVDEKQEIIHSLKNILTNPEIHLIAATSGHEAITMTLEHDIALILLDVSFQEINGFKTAKLLFQNDKTKNTPLIFISDKNIEKSMLLGYDLGAADYLFKPIHPKILNSKVSVFLNLYKQKTLLENQSFELEKQMTELSTVLLYLQEKEQVLEQQKKDLLNVNQELTDFAYIVSHDLKAPLRAISALVSWLATDHADSFNEDAKEQMNLLTGRVKRMHNLIDGVLQYSRIGRIKNQKVAVDLNELIHEVADLLALPENISLKIENKLPTIQFEGIRIEQVFQNLISNSIKYIDKPQGIIKISSTENKNHWEICVEDNGPGIEEKYYQKAFQIFQTLHQSCEFENTGIGLSLVKKIIENSGGEIWIESQNGIGCKFIFTVQK